MSIQRRLHGPETDSFVREAKKAFADHLAGSSRPAVHAHFHGVSMPIMTVRSRRLPCRRRSNPTNASGSGRTGHDEAYTTITRPVGLPSDPGATTLSPAHRSCGAAGAACLAGGYRPNPTRSDRTTPSATRVPSRPTRNAPDHRVESRRDRCRERRSGRSRASCRRGWALSIGTQNVT